MDGGVERRLNVGAFLHFLQSEHFRNVQYIFIPCGKIKGLFVNDIKQACPSVQTIVHSKWLMIKAVIFLAQTNMQKNNREQMYSDGIFFLYLRGFVAALQKRFNYIRLSVK